MIPITEEERSGVPCLNPSCDRPAFCRGLCRNCHQAAVRLVNRGSTSWDDLESRGKALPEIGNKNGGNKNRELRNRTKWLMEGTMYDGFAFRRKK